ncbi:MAG: hypothetical protein PGN09_11255 [Sphingomonas fennica]
MPSTVVGVGAVKPLRAMRDPVTTISLVEASVGPAVSAAGLAAWGLQFLRQRRRFPQGGAAGSGRTGVLSTGTCAEAALAANASASGAVLVKRTWLSRRAVWPMIFPLPIWSACRRARR